MKIIQGGYSMIKHIPIPTAGVMLGLVALGNLLKLQGFPDEVRWGCGIAAFLFGVLLTLRLILYPCSIKHDFTGNSILASVAATYFMSIMQLCTYTAGVAPLASQIVWFAAVFAHAALIIWFTWYYVYRFDLTDVFPTYFIAYVGIVVASVTAPVFHMEALGQAIFWFGFAAYIVLFIIVTYRYMHIAIPVPAKPLFCIYTAPMSLSLAGYFAVVPEPSFFLVIAMQAAAQILFFVVLVQMPKLLRLPFFPSYAAFTFPFVITAFTLKQSIEYFVSVGFSYPAVLEDVAMVETAIATVIVLYVVVRYVNFFVKEMMAASVLPVSTK
jgi:exfoliative toxin A/B